MPEPHEDIVTLLKGQITAIGLSTDGSTEYAGAGYSALAPTYGATAAGPPASADITATLEFDGGANDGPVTHLIFKRAEGDVIRPVDSPASFNSDGRLDVTSAPITSDFPA